MFRYLNLGLAVVLVFVGLKMIVEEPLRPYLAAQGIGEKHLSVLSLGVVSVILGVAVLGFGHEERGKQY